MLDDHELLAQHSKLMSPLVWDLAHVGNYEELWLLREAAGIDAMRPELDDIYDAFEHPRVTRSDAAAAAARRGRRLHLAGAPQGARLPRHDQPRPEHKSCSTPRFVFGMVLQHEHQHDETMLATHQLRRGDPVLPATDAMPAPGALITSAEVLVPAGPFTMGTSTDSWALDNERPAHEVDLASYLIDTVPVSNAAYRAFVEAGGYDDERLWTPAGWRWRCESGKRAPAFWFREGDAWLRRRFARVEPLPDDEPVQHVCWFEADAYARWAGRRLPTEAEWEKAASWDAATRTKRRFPWGDEAPTDDVANLGQTRYRPTAAGSFPAGRVAERRAADDRRRVGVDVDGLHRLPGLPVVPLQGVLRGLLRPGLQGAARRLLGDRPARLPGDVPQLGPPDPAADLQRLPHGARCVGTSPISVSRARSTRW